MPRLFATKWTMGNRRSWIDSAQTSSSVREVGDLSIGVTGTLAQVGRPPGRFLEEALELACVHRYPEIVERDVSSFPSIVNLHALVLSGGQRYWRRGT